MLLKHLACHIQAQHRVLFPISLLAQPSNLHPVGGGIGSSPCCICGSGRPPTFPHKRRSQGATFRRLYQQLDPLASTLKGHSRIGGTPDTFPFTFVGFTVEDFIQIPGFTADHQCCSSHPGWHHWRTTGLLNNLHRVQRCASRQD